MRKGLGAGQGKGYRNIIGKDPHVHRQSARGIRQPQHLPVMPVSKRVPQGWVFVDWKDASGKLWKDNIPRDSLSDFRARVTLNGGAVVKTQIYRRCCAPNGTQQLNNRKVEKPKNLVDFREQNQVSWAFSILSDAQELIDMGLYKEADEKINSAKRVLQGKYEVLDNNTIRVFSREEIRARAEKEKGTPAKMSHHSQHTKVKTVMELDKRTDLDFVNNDNEVQGIKDQLGEDASEYDSFFVKTNQGGFSEVWGMVGTVPTFNKRVVRLY